MYIAVGDKRALFKNQKELSMKRIVFGIGALVLMGIVGYLLQKSVTPSDESVLLLGTAGAYAPFVSVNEQGEYEGFDVDVANALAQQMGKKLVLKDLGSMTSLLMALEQGSIDGVIWGLSITQERLEKVAMVRYQGEVTKAYKMLFWQQIPEGIKEITDMRGMIVCVEPNSSQEAVLQKYDFITIKPTERVDDALLNIQYGKVDAAFVEPAIANKFKKRYPKIEMMDVELAPEDQVYGIGIAVRKDRTDLIGQMQKALDQLKKDGIMQIFEEKWEIV